MQLANLLKFELFEQPFNPFSNFALNMPRKKKFLLGSRMERSPDKPLSSFSAAADQLFKQFDRNADKQLDSDELYRACEDPSVTGATAKALSTILLNHDSLVLLNTDKSKSLNYEKIKNCTESLNDLNIQRTSAQSFLPEIEFEFSRIDKDKNRVLSIEELSNYSETCNKNKNAKGLASDFVIDNFNDIAQDPGHGIDQSDLFIYNHRLSKREQVLNRLDQTMEKLSRPQTEERSTALYKNSEHPLNSITPKNIKQGHIGDCYVEATIASIAATNPNVIHKMIRDNGNGSYSVQFPNEPVIVVKAPTETELLTYNQRTSEGTWTSILEKAYGILTERHSGKHSISAQHSMNDGGREREVMQAMLGGKAKIAWMVSDDCAYLVNQVPEQTRKTVDICSSRQSAINYFQKAFEEKRPLTCSTFFENNPGGYSCNHAYSIIGYDPRGKGGGTLTIRNPWGSKDVRHGDVETLSLDEFRKNFTQVDIGPSLKGI